MPEKSTWHGEVVLFDHLGGQFLGQNINAQGHHLTHGFKHDHPGGDGLAESARGKSSSGLKVAAHDMGIAQLMISRSESLLRHHGRFFALSALASTTPVHVKDRAAVAAAAARNRTTSATSSGVPMRPGRTQDGLFDLVQLVGHGGFDEAGPRS